LDEIDSLSIPLFTPLKQIFHPKGDVFHGMKKSDAGFEEFGEAYFTTVRCGEIKGWKKHTRMVMNLVVPVGSIRLYLREDASGAACQYTLGTDNYGRVTVPAGFWMAFEGVGDSLNLMLNLASIEHDPLEAVNVPPETFPFGEAK